MTSVEKTGNRRLSPEELEAFGAEMEAIRQRIVADLGEEDSAYIYDIVKKQRAFELAGRALFYLPVIGWVPAVACLSISKILDNMEIGHNVMHGQYDWMGDPDLNSRMFDWDTMAPAENWKYGHNYMHHTFTNIVGKDRDVGYGILRMDEDQKWHPYYLGNPLYAFLLMTFFEWGVAMHDLEVDELVAGRRTWAENKEIGARIWRKVKKQTLKDYVLFPLLTGPLAPLTFAGNFTANIIRNIWTFNIIFCGHFPAGVASFSQEECEDETQGHWYYRQLLGSANITGSRTFHIMSGNLSHQIEHHLFPDLPARRYPEIAEEVREICERYGLAYNTGPLRKQLFGVFKKICKYALPDRKSEAAAAAEPTPVLEGVAA
ncbi:fatty acid desaturase family protein [Nocardioides albus]|uniref:Fatty acid desaturase n=1 Tax=Nocardioides albus TaxID=1841 RepID=A0A7W5A3D0_9ACTN|nr:acyl-CoA desaturase [Nocardioides albus]MBB3088514.1 fatty acid desaturase [Nocardioides albus]GGU16825.1 fatty acid desaturase [Nocardioides albus]